MHINTTPVQTPADPNINLHEFDADDHCNERYKNAIGELWYLAHGTRPDIAYAVHEVAIHQAHPTSKHWDAVKRIYRYISGTKTMGLTYHANNDDLKVIIESYGDANWGDKPNSNRRSTTGYVVKINNNAIIWRSVKQSSVALSTAEAEYYALAAVVQEVLWIKQFLTELVSPLFIIPTPIIYSDNAAAISIAKEDRFHEKTKHIDIKFNFIRDHVEKKDFIIEWITTSRQLGDIFTKALHREQFIILRDMIMN